MGEYPLGQSAWRRGWSETKRVWTNWLFFVLDAVVAVVIGNIFGWQWGLAVVLFGMFCVWLGATVSAPVKQRNEARMLLGAKPRPIPLPNRTELISAIASMETTTIKLITQKNLHNDIAKKGNPPMLVNNALNNAYHKWDESIDELRRQYLIAGDAYENICTELAGFLLIQVGIKMGFSKPPDGDLPVILKDSLQFIGLLAGRIKQAIRKVDELSGQALDKGDSQS